MASETERTALRSTPAHRRTWAWILGVVAMLALLLLYRWSLQAVGGMGGPDREPAANDYYNHLVAGFLQGHLYMDLPVSDGLKALRDPYDPRQNEPYRLTDTSYYKGHYYLYFGAAPAVTLLLPFRLLTGMYLTTPVAILVFASIGFVAVAGLFLAMRQRYFADSPLWTAPVGVLILGVGSMADVLIRRPFFWELATTGGFAFAMLALGAVYAAIHSLRRRGRWMAAAGLSLGLAVASRPTYLYAVPMLVVPLFTWARLEGVTRAWWRMAAGAAVTLGAVGIATFTYNYARFGNGLEFGHNYLLSVAYESKVRLFGWDHVWFNTRMYFLLPGAWSWHPPFFAPVPVTRAEMPPGFYTVDDPFGLLRIFPVALLAFAAPLALVGRTGATRLQLGGLLSAVTLLFASAAAVILLYVATIPRYAVDFLPAFMVLTTLGLLAVVRLAKGQFSRRLVSSALLLVALVSLATGTLTLFDLGRLLSHTDPAAMERITAITTRIEALRDRAHGTHYGPVELDLRFPVSWPGHPETLLTAGSPTQPDRVLVEGAGPGQVRFGVQHADAAVQWSLAVRSDGAADHRVGVDLGSFYPPLEHGFFRGVSYDVATWLQHRSVLTVDGRVVLDTTGPFHPSRRGAPVAVDRAFSGTIVAVRQRPANLSPALPSSMQLPLTPGPDRQIGGVLRLQVLMPKGIKGAWVPFLQTGHAGAADTLSLDYMGENVVQFRFDHWGAPLVVGASVPVDENISHRVEVFLPSFAPGSFGQAADGEAWVKLDGREVLRTKTAAFGFTADEFTLGRNRLRAVMDDYYFRGAFVRREWVHAE